MCAATHSCHNASRIFDWVPALAAPVANRDPFWQKRTRPMLTRRRCRSLKIPEFHRYRVRNELGLLLLSGIFFLNPLRTAAHLWRRSNYHQRPVRIPPGSQPRQSPRILPPRLALIFPGRIIPHHLSVPVAIIVLKEMPN